MGEKREYRMYSIVMYNLSSMQKGVQTAHACMDYMSKFSDDKDVKQYVNEDKTLIILDGGTSQDIFDIQKLLKENSIKHSYFIEPDLNNAMSAVCFLADDRVWDKKTFLPYNEWRVINNYPIEMLMTFPPQEKENPEAYAKWVEYMGGNQNVFLRELVQYKPLAR